MQWVGQKFMTTPNMGGGGGRGVKKVFLYGQGGLAPDTKFLLHWVFPFTSKPPPPPPSPVDK